MNREPFFPDMLSVKDAVGGAVSFSLSDRKYSLGEVKRALMVLAASFLEAWYQKSGTQHYENQEEVVYGEEKVEDFFDSLIQSKMDRSNVVRVQDAINKAVLSSGKKSVVNNRLETLTNKLFRQVPVDDIVDILDKEGIVLLQEDFTPWAGFLFGSEAQADFPIGDKNQPVTNEWGTQYTPYANIYLHLIWRKIGFGKYGIVASLI